MEWMYSRECCEWVKHSPLIAKWMCEWTKWAFLLRELDPWMQRKSMNHSLMNGEKRMVATQHRQLLSELLFVISCFQKCFWNYFQYVIILLCNLHLLLNGGKSPTTPTTSLKTKYRNKSLKFKITKWNWGGFNCRNGLQGYISWSRGSAQRIGGWIF